MFLFPQGLFVGRKISSGFPCNNHLSFWPLCIYRKANSAKQPLKIFLRLPCNNYQSAWWLPRNINVNTTQNISLIPIVWSRKAESAKQFARMWWRFLLNVFARKSFVNTTPSPSRPVTKLPQLYHAQKSKKCKNNSQSFFFVWGKTFSHLAALTNLPLLGSTRKLAAKDFAPFIKEINWFKFMQYGLATIQTIPKNLKKNLNSKQWTWNFQLLRSKLPFYFCFSQSSKSFSTPFSCLCEIAFFHLQCICHYLRPFFCQLTFFPSLVNVSCLQTICDSCKSSNYK